MEAKLVDEVAMVEVRTSVMVAEAEEMVVVMITTGGEFAMSMGVVDLPVDHWNKMS